MGGNWLSATLKTSTVHKCLEERHNVTPRWTVAGKAAKGPTQFTFRIQERESKLYYQDGVRIQIGYRLRATARSQTVYSQAVDQ